jgi:hypothetical protein
MSDKLKIMQALSVPARLFPIALTVLVAERIFYKFEVCSGRQYFIEVNASYACLSAAMERLRSEFAVDAFGYCENCSRPHVQKISVISALELPQPGDALVFISFMN